MQPEDKLLDPSRLRGELLRRGMTDLLQAFLEEAPPIGDRKPPVELEFLGEDVFDDDDLEVEELQEDDDAPKDDK